MRFGIVFIGALLLASTSIAQQVPRPARDYPVTLPDGKTLNVSKYKGKVVAVEFLLTTCPHCQKTAVALTKVEKELGPKGFQVIGVALNDNPDVPGFIKQFDINFPVGVGPREPVYDFLQHSVMNPRLNFPQFVLIDRKGIVQEQHDGTDAYLETDPDKNIRASVMKLLGAAPAKKTSASSAVKKGS